MLHGIPCSVLSPDDALERRILDKLDAAIDLVRLHDPRRFLRLASDIPRILVYGHETAYAGTLLSSLGWCVFTVRYAGDERCSPEDLAPSLVHEATHARLRHFHLPDTYACRRRQETVCAKQELAFAPRIPSARNLVLRAQQRLALYASRTDAEWADVFRNDDDTERLMSENGVPRWLAHILSRLGGRVQPNQRLQRAGDWGSMVE
jgi:hypothetical protein